MLDHIYNPPYFPAQSKFKPHSRHEAEKAFKEISWSLVLGLQPNGRNTNLYTTLYRDTYKNELFRKSNKKNESAKSTEEDLSTLSRE